MQIETCELCDDDHCGVLVCSECDVVYCPGCDSRNSTPERPLCEECGYDLEKGE